MNLLCFDIASGGMTATVFDSRLKTKRTTEDEWDLEIDSRGAATLSVERVVESFRRCIHELDLTSGDSVDGICIGTFLHNCVLLDQSGQPLTPVFTWLDHRGDTGLEYVRSRFGDRYHRLTGCRYHPMFPVFKLASMRLNDPDVLAQAKRVVSIKALLLNQLTGAWVEDHGTASASGLFNITEADWDAEVLEVIGLERAQLPDIGSRTDTVGRVTSKASAEYGLAEGVPVIVGSGDGFLANVGSDCEVPAKIAVTLGTSAVVRQTLIRPVVDISAGTFCYRADEHAYLLGCAGSNGGNVLDWGRQIFGTVKEDNSSEDPPIFLPLLHGERSPDWNPHLTGSWQGLTARHTAADLSRSILEGVIFNLGHFIEIVQQTSGERPTDLVLSGNGFLYPMAAPMLAAVTGISTWTPGIPGLASLRGAGICALRALAESIPALEVHPVSPLPDPKIIQRYSEYRRLRGRVMTR